VHFPGAWDAISTRTASIANGDFFVITSCALLTPSVPWSTIGRDGQRDLRIRRSGPKRPAVFVARLLNHLRCGGEALSRVLLGRSNLATSKCDRIAPIASASGARTHSSFRWGQLLNENNIYGLDAMNAKHLALSAVLIFGVGTTHAATGRNR
jgi:hypothetical protein